MAKQRVALGLLPRTGRATVVALGGSADAPGVLAKARIDVATTFDEGAVFHLSQESSLEKARVFLKESERRFITRAKRELTAFVAPLGGKVLGVGMVAGPAKSLPPLETLLKSHPLVHTAEGELYRRVFSEAAEALGVRPVRTPAEELVERVAAALGLSSHEVTKRLAAIGKVSGKPWAAEQRRAALAAWLVFANRAASSR